MAPRLPAVHDRVDDAPAALMGHWEFCYNQAIVRPKTCFAIGRRLAKDIASAPCRGSDHDG